MEKAKIQTILHDVAKTNNITITSAQMHKPLNEIGIDSLQGINIILQIEEKFNVKIDDLTKLKTPNDIVNEFAKLLKD
jgi:acyl carrier protein